MNNSVNRTNNRKSMNSQIKNIKINLKKAQENFKY